MNTRHSAQTMHHGIVHDFRSLCHPSERMKREEKSGVRLGTTGTTDTDLAGVPKAHSTRTRVSRPRWHRLRLTPLENTEPDALTHSHLHKHTQHTHPLVHTLTLTPPKADVPYPHQGSDALLGHRIQAC